MSNERRPLIAGNWKMHKTVAEAEQFISGLLPLIYAAEHVDIAVCPPYTALQAMVDSARGSLVQVYAQNMHYAEQGAYTGEVSAAMLSELEVAGVVLGHSERREYYAENDKALAQKLPVALAQGLAPVLCVGETESERESGDTERKLRHQIQEGLSKLSEDQLSEVVIAYEPIWAIGTGKVASAEQAQEACAFIRALIAQRSVTQAEQTRVLYGGSVKADNAAELLALPDIDGALVGGASLEPESFAAIIAAAA